MARGDWAGRGSRGKNVSGGEGHREEAGARAARGEDADLEVAVRSLQAGAGPAAFEPIYRSFYRPLRAFFERRPALREEAEDLAQETLLRVYKRIDQYHPQASFGAWVRRIAENVWKNAARDRRAAKRGAPESLSELAGERNEGPPIREAVFRGEEPTPEDTALDEERTKVLREALAELPAGMRRATELRLLDHRYHEIAELMGIGLNSVRSQLFEARKRLRPVLERYFGDAEL